MKLRTFACWQASGNHVAGGFSGNMDSDSLHIRLATVLVPRSPVGISYCVKNVASDLLRPYYRFPTMPPSFGSRYTHMVKPFRLVGDQAHVPLLAEVFNFSILCRA